MQSELDIVKQRRGFPALSGVSAQGSGDSCVLDIVVCFHWVFPAHIIVINLFAFPADVAGL